MEDSAIRRYARQLRIGILVVFGLLLALIAAGRFGLRVAGAPVILQSRIAPIAGPFSVSDGILLLLAIAIYWLSEALRAVAAGELFSRVVVRRFRLFALWMLIMAIFSTLAPMLLSASRPAQGPHHRIAIVIDVRDLLLIGLTVLVFLIARMFERARALDEEVRKFV